MSGWVLSHGAPGTHKARVHTARVRHPRKERDRIAGTQGCGVFRGGISFICDLNEMGAQEGTGQNVTAFAHPCALEGEVRTLKTETAAGGHSGVSESVNRPGHPPPRAGFCSYTAQDHGKGYLSFLVAPLI